MARSEQGVSSSPAKPTVPETSEVDQKQGTSGEEPKFLLPNVFSSTITTYSIFSTTTTIPYTCYSSIVTNVACTGRRRRRRRRHSLLPHLRLVETQLDDGDTPLLRSSVDSGRLIPDDDDLARLALTSWITMVSSTTSTSTVTNFATTVQFNILCTLGTTPAKHPSCAG